MKLPNFSILTFSTIQIAFIGCSQNSNVVDTLNTSISSDIPKDSNAISNSISYGRKEMKILDTIYSLKEIKDRQRYIEQHSKGARHLQIWVADTPNLNHPYYFIQVGEDNGTNLVTHFNFFVYPHSFRIMHLDTENDRTVTLSQWREENGM